LLIAFTLKLNYSEPVLHVKEDTKIKHSSVSATLFISTIVLLSAFATILQPTQVNGATSTFGNTSVGNQSYYIAKYKDACKVELTLPGTIQSLSVYFGSSQFNAKAAIYSDSNGLPGALISQSASKRISATGWTTFTVPTRSLSAGKYWLAIVADSSRAQGRITYSGSDVEHVQKQSGVYFGSEFTNSFGQSSLSNSGTVSIYASYVSLPPPTPTPAPSPTPTPAPTPTPTPAPTPSPTPFNLVQNGNFETGTSPWTVYISDPNSQGYSGTLTQTTNAYQGTYSGQFTVTAFPQGSGYIITSQALQPQIGTTYTLKFNYKTTMNVYPHVFCFNSQWQQIQLFTGAICQTTSTWKEATMTVGPIPQGAVRTELHFDVASTGTLQFDNVVATTQVQSTPTPVPTPTSTPIPSPTAAPTASPTPRPSSTATPTSSPTPTPSPSPAMQIGIYSNPTCTTKLSSISWGQLTPGQTKTMTLYIRNEGTTQVSLTKSLANWNPANLSAYLALNWNYSNQTIAPTANVAVTLSLTVASNTPATTSFGFDTTLTAVSN
jgi:outer membrane biosynthesis protein TonB